MPGIKPKSGQGPARDKGPRKPRPHGFARRRMAPTRRVEHVLESCPQCGTGLAGGWVQRTREVIDLPLVPAQVTEHVFIARTCPVCERRRTPQADLGRMVLGKQRLGVNLLSRIAALREEGRLPLRTIQWYLQTVHRLPLSLGAIVRAIHQVAQKAQPAWRRFGTESGQPSGARRRNRLASGRGQRLRLDLQHPHRPVLSASGSEQGSSGRGAGHSFSGVGATSMPLTIITRA